MADKAKLTIAVYSFDLPNSACAYYRILSPLTALKDRVACIWAVRMDAAANIQGIDVECLKRADLIVIQRFFPLDITTPVIERILASGKPVVYETDDFFFDIPDDNPTAGLARRATAHTKELLRHVAAATVPTPALATRLAPYAANVVVLPNYLDERIWNAPLRRRKSAVVVGFAGSVTHARDLEMIEDALLDIADRYAERVAIRLMGCTTERLVRHPRVATIEHVTSYEAYARAMQRSGMDIGLAPLVPSEFNVCKSNIKWLEYAACGVAGVFQDLAPYTTCVAPSATGLFAGTSAVQWRDQIEYLLENPRERLKIAALARQEVLGRYALSTGKARFLEFYEKVAAGEALKSSKC